MSKHTPGPRPGQGVSGLVFRATSRVPDRLTAADVRAVRFQRRPWWRTGLDPDEVAGFLWLVARELERRQRQVHAAQAELDRLKAALRDWRNGGGQATAHHLAYQRTDSAT